MCPAIQQMFVGFMTSQYPHNVSEIPIPCKLNYYGKDSPSLSLPHYNCRCVYFWGHHLPQQHSHHLRAHWRRRYEFTDMHNCPRSMLPNPGQGNFYYPSGDAVLTLSHASLLRQSLYRTRSTGSISLRQQAGEISPPLGRYRCEIPDSRGALQNLYITIGEAACLPKCCYVY